MRGRKNRQFLDDDFSNKSKDRRAERRACMLIKEARKMKNDEWDDFDTSPERHRRKK